MMRLISSKYGTVLLCPTWGTKEHGCTTIGTYCRWSEHKQDCHKNLVPDNSPAVFSAHLLFPVAHKNREQLRDSSASSCPVDGCQRLNVNAIERCPRGQGQGQGQGLGLKAQ
ncbi:hypothetical protein MPTK2_2g12660 [Marchantia polymorpha subsp. ruderalis]